MRALLMAMIGTAALALAGCGTEDAAKKLDPVAEAADRTLGAGTARIDGEMTMRLPGHDELTTEIDGAADFARDRVRMTMRATGDVPREVEAVYPMTVAMDGTTMYQRLPGLEKELPDGKSWIKVDLEEAVGGELPADFGTGGDPGAMLESLKRAGETRKVGTERIDGERMTHYRAVIDVEKALSQDGADLSPRVRRQMKAMAGRRIPVDVWIDSEGRLRRQEQTMRVPAGGGEKVETKVTMTFDDFDEDVQVELPSDEDAHDMTEQVAGQLGG